MFGDKEETKTIILSSTKQPWILTSNLNSKGTLFFFTRAVTGLKRITPEHNRVTRLKRITPEHNRVL